MVSKERVARDNIWGELEMIGKYHIINNGFMDNFNTSDLTLCTVMNW